VGVGSQSNVDAGENPDRAAINRYNPDGSGHELYATARAIRSGCIGTPAPILYGRRCRSGMNWATTWCPTISRTSKGAAFTAGFQPRGRATKTRGARREIPRLVASDRRRRADSRRTRRFSIFAFLHREKCFRKTYQDGAFWRLRIVEPVPAARLSGELIPSPTESLGKIEESPWRMDVVARSEGRLWGRPVPSYKCPTASCW